MNDNLTTSRQSQEEEKKSLLSSLAELKTSNQSFIESSLSKIYSLLTSTYSSLSITFSSQIPKPILSLKQPLMENIPDKSMHLSISAGSTHDHSISVTVVFFWVVLVLLFLERQHCSLVVFLLRCECPLFCSVHFCCYQGRGDCRKGTSCEGRRSF